MSVYSALKTSAHVIIALAIGATVVSSFYSLMGKIGNQETGARELKNKPAKELNIGNKLADGLLKEVQRKRLPGRKITFSPK